MVINMGKAVRKSMHSIVASVNGKRSIHFNEQPLAGLNGNVWFPVHNDDLFEAVECILQVNLGASNVVLEAQETWLSDSTCDYLVSYSVPVV